MNFSELLAVLKERGFSLSVCQEEPGTEPLLEIRPNPDEALSAEIKRHRSSLLAFAEGGDCALCEALGQQRSGSHATVDGCWWCAAHWLASAAEPESAPTCSRCPAPLYRFTPTGEATCGKHFSLAIGEWIGVAVVACRHCGAPSTCAGTTDTAHFWAIYQCSAQPAHTTAVEDQAEAQLLALPTVNFSGGKASDLDPGLTTKPLGLTLAEPQALRG